MDRELLYERIDARTEAIVASGAVEEVRRAEAAGPSRTARKALGFDELLGGDIELMKKRSRNYARRQLTWMRKIPNLEWSTAAVADDAEIAAEIVRRLTLGGGTPELRAPAIRDDYLRPGAAAGRQRHQTSSRPTEGWCDLPPPSRWSAPDRGPPRSAALGGSRRWCGVGSAAVRRGRVDQPKETLTPGASPGDDDDWRRAALRRRGDRPQQQPSAALLEVDQHPPQRSSRQPRHGGRWGSASFGGDLSGPSIIGVAFHCAVRGVRARLQLAAPTARLFGPCPRRWR